MVKLLRRVFYVENTKIASLLEFTRTIFKMSSNIVTLNGHNYVGLLYRASEVFAAVCSHFLKETFNVMYCST